MARIVIAAEQSQASVATKRREPFRQSTETDEFTDALAGAANYAAAQLDAKFLVVFLKKQGADVVLPPD